MFVENLFLFVFTIGFFILMALSSLGDDPADAICRIKETFTDCRIRKMKARTDCRIRMMKAKQQMRSTEEKESSYPRHPKLRQLLSRALSTAANIVTVVEGIWPFLKGLLGG